jgi:hypothetical protein
MSLEKSFLIGFVFLFIVLILLQIYFGVRLKKNQHKIGQDAANASVPRMSAKAGFRFGLFLVFFYLYIFIVAFYYVKVGLFPVLLGVVIFVVQLFLIRKPIKIVRDNLPAHSDLSVVLPLLPRFSNIVTPELIIEILREDCVIDAIKKDLQKTRQICGKEQWRLGLLSPELDLYDLSYNQLSRTERMKRLNDAATMINLDNQIPIKRAAILHATSFFNTQFNNLLIIHGTSKPLIEQYPGWSFSLKPQIPSHHYRNIRDIEINTDSLSARNRNRSLPKFLQEDGFPIKDNYVDGDPLTTERGGTIVIDKGKIKIIYLNYFIQSRLIDDEGNLVYMGLDENFHSSSTWRGVSLIPTISKKLYKCVAYNDYAPIFRYRSFPFASNFMLPILDTPMSDSGWADLFIDTRGKAKLFIAKQKTLEEWVEMMEKLRQLFFGELAKKDNHLLSFTKDQMQLDDYFTKKQQILEDYFLVIDWSVV